MEQEHPVYRAGEPVGPRLLYNRLLWGREQIEARYATLLADETGEPAARQSNLKLEAERMALVESQLDFMRRTHGEQLLLELEEHRE